MVVGLMSFPIFGCQIMIERFVILCVSVVSPCCYLKINCCTNIIQHLLLDRMT